MEEFKAHEVVLSDCVGDNDVYQYDSRYDDCTGYYDAIRSDVIRPQTDSDESPATLNTNIMGAVGTLSPRTWSQTGGAEGT